MNARDIYPPIDLEHGWPSCSRTTHLTVSAKINPCPQTLCFSATLFKRNSANTYDDEKSVDEAAWHVKYYQSLVENCKTLPKLGEKYKLRLYLANDLASLTDELVKLAPFQIEIYLMQSSSIGHGPGASWRFLALSDTTLDIVGVVDIDEPLTTKFIDALDGAPSEKLLCKQAAQDPTIHSRNGKVFAQYHMFQAGKFAMRPTLKKIPDILDKFIDYALTHISMEHAGSHAGKTLFNVPRAGHPWGWGMHPYVYGFDETFLKRVIYPMFDARQVIYDGKLGELESHYFSC